MFSLLFSFLTFAAPAPYTVEAHKRFNDVEARATAVESRATAVEGEVDALQLESSLTGTGLKVVRYARATYTANVTTGTIGAHGLGVSLPAKAVITRSWFYTNAQFVDAGSGTVALSCEDANNIFTATDITGNAAGVIVEGASTGAASAFKASIANACEITATVAGAAQTAGSLTVFVEYVVHD